MSKRDKIIYWVATLWLSLGMVSTGVVQLLKQKEGTGGVDSLVHLGFPIYLLTILGVWKILGTIAVLVPRFGLVKEWAYAGFFFTTTGAFFSHVAVGDSWKEFSPSLLLLALTVLSWYFRPESRKVVSAS